MSIAFFIKLYLLTVPVFFIIDMLWLGLIAKKLYWSKLGPVVPLQVNWGPAIIFYLMYIVGIIIFAVRPGLIANSLQTTLIWAALFGFFTYATYDLTNMATIKDWPLSIVLMDIAWGVVLCSAVGSASFFLGKWLLS